MVSLIPKEAHTIIYIDAAQKKAHHHSGASSVDGSGLRLKTRGRSVLVLFANLLYGFSAL